MNGTWREASVQVDWGGPEERIGRKEEGLIRKEKASREDRTPDLSLTKRVLYRLSY